MPAMNRGPAMDSDHRATVAAGVCLSVIGCAAFLILPQLVAAAAADLRFSDRQLGFLSAMLMAGSALSAVVSTFWVRRLSWRRVAVLAALGVVATNVVACYVHAAWPFMILQCLSGFFGGSLYSLSLTVLSDTRDADRHFGYAVAAQAAFQVAGLVAGPRLVGLGGINAFLYLFIGLNAAALLLVPLLPVAGHDRATSHAGARLWGGPTLLALAGCFLFFFNVGCYWTYIEPIGTGAGLSAQTTANGLALGVTFGIAGALLASWLGDRHGRLLPVGISACLTAAAALVLLAPIGVTSFAASAIVYNVAWNLSLAFQYSTVNAVDRSGRGVAAAPAFHAAGGSAGPVAAALLIGPGDFRAVILLVTLSVLMSYACFALSLRTARGTPVTAPAGV